jgi:hypothetical protein
MLTEVNVALYIYEYDTMLDVRRSRVRFLMTSLIFFHSCDTSSRIRPWGLAQTLREMNSRNLHGDKERTALKADNFTATCGPIV